jgi:predicted glycosyltransferase
LAAYAGRLQLIGKERTGYEERAMRIVVEVTHPAHVHFFRNAIAIWKDRGHQVAVTAREKDITIALLKNYNIDFEAISRVGGSKLGLLAEMVNRDYKLWRFCRKFKPDVLTAISGVFAAHAGFAIRKPVVVWDDTEHQKISHWLTYPFVSQMQSPDCYTKHLGKKQVRYAGCHELAYLHPNRFAPSKDIVRSLGIEPDEKYCLIRLVSWQAHHDVGQHGFDDRKKSYVVEQIARYAQPYITSEAPLPPELEKYQLKIPYHLIHHVMAFASLCVTEGATMASESALLGVPAIYINTLGLGYIDMLEGYGLIKQTTNTEQVLEFCLGFLRDSTAVKKCRQIRDKMLNSKIDVTDYLVKTIERYG